MSSSDCRFEKDGDVCVFRLQGAWSFWPAVRAIDGAIGQTRAAGVRCLLVVITDAHGFAPPSLFERQTMIRTWAQTGDGMVTVAMVVPPAYVDPERFGVVTAANFGITGNVFLAEAEALAWLRQGSGSGGSQV